MQEVACLKDSVCVCTFMCACIFVCLYGCAIEKYKKTNRKGDWVGLDDGLYLPSRMLYHRTGWTVFHQHTHVRTAL